MLKYQQEKNSHFNTPLNTVIDELKKLMNKLVTKERKKHILGVANFSIKLAERLGLSPEKRQKLLIVAFAHDLFRDVDVNKLIKMSKAFGISPSFIELKKPILLHSKVAAEFLKIRFKINDEEILEAIKYHTSGHKDMGLLAKIIFVADSLEESREYPGIEELRKLIFEDFTKGFFEILKNKISYVIANNLIMLPDLVELWNETILKGVEKV